VNFGIKDHIARERGLLIHRLLQYLPDVTLEKREQTLKNFMQRYAARFTPAEARVVETEVMSILLHPEFAEVFGAHSVAEVPLSGIVTDNNGNKLVISGQIDRLAVSGDNVYIIDYKTNREVPASENAVPAGYLRQMDAYRRLITQIYPDKTVHCALLWTARPALMTGRLKNAYMLGRLVIQ
jgi:ATP-dependent helicase/nuclease subunit A